MYKSELLVKVLASSIQNLFTNQPTLSKFTSETHETEWNLGHHIAQEISKYIFWLDYDLDVRKSKAHDKRPDIVFHKRGNHDNNFLVIELKREGNSSDGDIEKIKEYWMKKPYLYSWGAIIVLDVENKAGNVIS